MLESTTGVVPAKAGTQRRWSKRHWIPAFAGMTMLRFRGNDDVEDPGVT